jgi:hypothetical protein
VAQPLENEPRDLLLGLDNDLIITNDLDWSRGIAAVAQSCRIKLQMFRGEWFLDLDEGIPFWDDILGQKAEAAIAVARQEFRAALLAIEGVLEISKLEVSFESTTRLMRITWQVRTALGETPVDTLEV